MTKEMEQRWLGDEPISGVRPRRMAFVLGGIVVLAAVLRLLYLPDKSLWLDEAFSAWTARLDWLSFVTVLSEERNMTFYYLLLHLWLGLGESEFVLRSLSVIFAVATVPVLYALATHLFGMRVGLVGALLLAVNAFHIQYAQEARGYSLVMFLVTTASLFFVRGIERPTGIRWIGYILFSAAGIYTHFFAALVPVAHCASLAFLPHRQVPWKGLVWSIFSIGFLILPVVVLVLVGDAQQISWIPEPGLFSMLRAFYALAGAGGPPLFVAYFIACLIALLQAGKAWSFTGPASRPWHYGFLLTWLFVPMVLALAVSIITPVFSLRYLIICLPSMTLLAAVGISSVRHRWLFVGIVIVVVSLASRGIFTYYNAPKEDWRAVTRYVVSEAQSGDAALFYLPLGRIPFEYYRERLDGLPERPAVVFPSQTDYSTLFRDLRRVPPDKTLLDKLPLNYSRIWLILGSRWEHAPVADAIQASVASSYHIVEKTEFTDITVVLYGNTYKRSDDTIGTLKLPGELRTKPLLVALHKHSPEIIVGR